MYACTNSTRRLNNDVSLASKKNYVTESLSTLLSPTPPAEFISFMQPLFDFGSKDKQTKIRCGPDCTQSAMINPPRVGDKLLLYPYTNATRIESEIVVVMIHRMILFPDQ
jgi:hypothetical protein